MSWKKILIAVGGVLVLGVIAYLNLGLNRTPSTSVTTEKIQKRDLESIVTASGKVQPKRNVNISAETSGKVVDLRVNEGDVVKAGQLLLQIDPKNLETSAQNRQASLDAANVALEQAKAQVENSRLALQQAKDNYARADASWKAGGLIPRVEYERAEQAVATATTNLKLSEQAVTAQEKRIKQEQANLDTASYDLKKVSLVSPIDGIVTKRNIEQGETAVVGTMNNAGTVLLTIADLSVIETEIEVDETDIPSVHVGQTAKVTIDAIKDKTFTGKVTEVGNSPIAVAGSATRATNFKVTVTIDGIVEGVRPGFTCTAVVTTATRQQAVSVPIQAMAMRELIVDASGQVVKPEAPPAGTSPTVAARRAAASAELKPGQTRKELEGVFLLVGGKAQFTPVKTGIAGEKYFEIVSGLKEGDEVITGPFQSVRNLKDGDQVKSTGSGPATTTTNKS